MAGIEYFVLQTKWYKKLVWLMLNYVLTDCKCMNCFDSFFIFMAHSASASCTMLQTLWRVVPSRHCVGPNESLPGRQYTRQVFSPCTPWCAGRRKTKQNKRKRNGKKWKIENKWQNIVIHVPQICNKIQMIMIRETKNQSSRNSGTDFFISDARVSTFYFKYLSNQL